MRVLFFESKLDGQSGQTIYLSLLGKGLVKKGIQCGIAYENRSGVDEAGVKRLLADGFSVYHIPFPKLEGRIDLHQTILMTRKFIQAHLGIFRAVKAFKPDIIHVNNRGISIFAQELAYLMGIPFITILHRDDINSSLPFRLMSFWGSRVIAISSEVRSVLLEQFYVQDKKIELVFNGVDETHFRPPAKDEREAARKVFNITDKDFVVSCVGRLVSDKRHELVLKAIAVLKHRGIRVTVLCAGEGPMRGELLRLAEELQIREQVRFPGFVDSRLVQWAADVFVLPSRFEGFGLVGVEAMSCGNVPIRTPAAGAKDQIDDGVNGFIVPFDDYHAIADKIEFLLTHPSILQKMSLAAREKVIDRFTLGKMVDRTIEVYREVLGERSKVVHTSNLTFG